MTTSYSIKKTKADVAHRFCIHGGNGVGKTTLAAGSPSPVFITAEDGLINIDGKAIDPAPRTWEEVLGAVEYVRDESGAKTLVLDSLDWIEPMCWDHVVRQARSPKISKIEDFGYGKGYIAAIDEWRVLIRSLGTLRLKGINVIAIAHSIAKVFKNPEGDDYDRWQMKLHVQAAALWSEWVDVLGFAQVETSTYEQNNRVKGLSTGRRVLRTDKTAAFEAKSRYAMPRSIALDWATLEKHVRGGDKDEVVRLQMLFEDKVIELGDLAVEANARNYLGSRGITVPTLTEAIEVLNQKLAAKATGAKT